jgi:hypothetical protein
MALEIRGNQIIRTSAPADIDSGGSGTYQITIAIERVQKSRRIRVAIRLDSPQCFFIYEKRGLHGAVVPPKPRGAPVLVVRTTMVRKINHVIDPDRFVAGSHPFVSGLESADPHRRIAVASLAPQPRQFGRGFVPTI